MRMKKLIYLFVPLLLNAQPVFSESLNYLNVKMEVARKGKNYIYDFMKKVPEGTTILIEPKYAYKFCDFKEQVFSYKNQFGGETVNCSYIKKNKFRMK